MWNRLLIISKETHNLLGCGFLCVMVRCTYVLEKYGKEESIKMNTIEIKNISKQIKKRYILKDVSLDIQEGEIFGLLGPNGAGKTTLVKVIMGLMKSTSGEVFIAGKDIQKDFCEAITNIRGLIEQPAIYPHLSGYNNLKIFADMDKVSKKRIEEVIEIIGLPNDIHRKAKEYSLGMKQRLGIGIALLSKPKVLILDEPTNGLDPEGVQELREYLKKIAREENVTVIVSSHILAEMNLLCDRFAIIKKGELKKVVKKNEYGMQDDASQFFIEVDDALKAYRLLQDNYKVEMRDSGVLIYTTKEEIAKINADLVHAERKVFGISMVENPLEKFYFEIINGKEEDTKNV